MARKRQRLFWGIATISVCIVCIGILAPFGNKERSNNALAAPVACGAWKVTSSPTGSGEDYLQSVTALSTKNAWAVGTMIEHWNGTAWSTVPSPAVKLLNGVAAITPQDIWAVGRPIVHWDGKHWSTIQASGSYLLLSVSAVSSRDIWAVGKTDAGKALLEHWDGKHWTIVANPSLGKGSALLQGVAAIASNNVWTVGVLEGGKPLIEHWDGKLWHVVNAPALANKNISLNGLQALSAQNIWAVGGYIDARGKTMTPLVAHWNGLQWSIVPAPTIVNGLQTQLNSIAGQQPNNLWAAGFSTDGGAFTTLIEHWNGSHWSIMKSPNFGIDTSELAGISVVPNSKQVWAVGDGNVSSSNFSPFILNYC